MYTDIFRDKSIKNMKDYFFMIFHARLSPLRPLQYSSPNAYTAHQTSKCMANKSF